MIDVTNFTPNDDGFRVINATSWIYIGSTGNGYLYQKVADGYPIFMVVSSPNYIPAPSYREWAEQRDGIPWEQIAAKYKEVTK